MKLKYIFIAQFILLAVLPYQSAFGQFVDIRSDCSGTPITVIPGTLSVDADGDGLIEICTAQGLSDMRNDLNGRTYNPSDNTEDRGSTEGCPTLFFDARCDGYELGNDIDLKGVDWEPILGFNARFEGNGYVIKNLTINVPSQGARPVGLFGSVTNNATTNIRNVGLIDINITGGDSSNSNLSFIGGLVGLGGARITNSYATGTINVRGQTVIGGLVGSPNRDTVGLISNNYSAVNIQGDYWVGGLVGVNCTNFSNQCNAGSQRRVIRNSYATGNLTGNTVGGLVAEIGGSMMNVYATGKITVNAGDDNVGGGLIAKTANNTNTDIGAFNSHWNSETSGFSTSVASRTDTSGLTTVQMQSPTAPSATNPARYGKLEYKRMGLRHFKAVSCA